MNVIDLISILNGWPPSLKLKVHHRTGFVFETTVCEMIIRLMDLKRDQSPPLIMTLFGCSSFVFREKCDRSGGDAVIPRDKQWLEMSVW